MNIMIRLLFILDTISKKSLELRRVEDFTPYIGQELQAEIIEVDLEKKRIVVSRRDLLKAEREAKAKAYKEMKEAQAQARKEARAAAEEAAYASRSEEHTSELQSRE